MPIRGQLKVGDKVYRALSNEPHEVIAIIDGKAHLKCGLDQRWVKVASMAYTYTIVGTAEDIQLRSEFRRHGYKIFGDAS